MKKLLVITTLFLTTIVCHAQDGPILTVDQDYLNTMTPGSTWVISEGEILHGFECNSTCQDTAAYDIVTNESSLNLLYVYEEDVYVFPHCNIRRPSAALQDSGWEIKSLASGDQRISKGVCSIWLRQSGSSTILSK